MIWSRISLGTFVMKQGASICRLAYVIYDYTLVFQVMSSAMTWHDKVTNSRLRERNGRVFSEICKIRRGAVVSYAIGLCGASFLYDR
jgi:hypothetical protein